MAHPLQERKQSNVTLRSARPDEDPIATQVDGYWLAPDEGVPPRRPAYRPTGALLPPTGAALGTGAVCLDLVSVSYRWVPLSEAGVFTYSHSQGLQRGERWRFVVWAATAPTVFEVELGDPISYEDIKDRFGREAMSRSRPDRPTVTLKVRRTS